MQKSYTIFLGVLYIPTHSAWSKQENYCHYSFRQFRENIMYKCMKCVGQLKNQPDSRLIVVIRRYHVRMSRDQFCKRHFYNGNGEARIAVTTDCRRGEQIFNPSASSCCIYRTPKENNNNERRKNKMKRNQKTMTRHPTAVVEPIKFLAMISKGKYCHPLCV